MVLTAAGKRLLAGAESVLAAAQSLQNDARAMKGEVVGKVRIGTLSDPAFIRIGEFISTATRRHPLLDLELHQGVTGEVLERVRDGALDASFYYGELKFPSVTGMPLREIVYRVAAPASWCERIRAANWNEIANEAWIIPPLISTHHQLVHDLLNKHGVEPSRVIEADQETVVGSLVLSGVGMALMREDVAKAHEAAGEVCLWDGVKTTSTVWVIHLKDRESDPVIRALLEVLKDVWQPHDAMVATE
jgi:DNA-binding transcriptional LysR family regulator